MAKQTNILYGISNCDTVKKARQWLDKNNVTYQFVDFRKDGIQAKQVQSWVKSLGLDIVVNKRSTTWKNLSKQQQSVFADPESISKAVEVIVNNPTLIKRPLLETGGCVRQVGFKEADYRATFS